MKNHADAKGWLWPRACFLAAVGKGDGEGLTWTVASAAAPPSTVCAYDHGHLRGLPNYLGPRGAALRESSHEPSTESVGHAYWPEVTMHRQEGGLTSQARPAPISIHKPPWCRRWLELELWASLRCSLYLRGGHLGSHLGYRAGFSHLEGGPDGKASLTHLGGGGGGGGWS